MKKILGALDARLMSKYTWNIRENWGISKKGLVSGNGRDKNSMSLRDGSPTQYGGTYKVFFEKKN